MSVWMFILKNKEYLGNFTKCLKNQQYDVIKMREMRGEVEKETPKK